MGCQNLNLASSLASGELDKQRTAPEFSPIGPAVTITIKELVFGSTLSRDGEPISAGQDLPRWVCIGSDRAASFLGVSATRDDPADECEEAGSRKPT